VSYVDWADWYPAGTGELDGVTVHRLPILSPRSDRFFGPLNQRVVWGREAVPLHVQEQWIRSSGPELSDLVPWLAERAPAFDAAVFFTYLYYPTWAGLPVAAGLVPTVLHPTAHDEPPLYLPLFDTTFRHPSAFAFSTEEEKQLVGRRFGIGRPSAVIGIGVDLEAAEGADEDAFRGAYGLGDRPYLACIGRLDPAKGSEELFDFFAVYKARNPGPLALVLVGDPARRLEPHPDVVVTGILDDEMKRSALAGALALVQPSYFESFSMVLTEAWAQRKPALVQGACQVLEGQVRRSGGGIPYQGFAEFEAGVDLMLADPGLARALGDSGRCYVEAQYPWDSVLNRYNRLLLSATYARSASSTLFT
jgi:glycosyltransferase involved in cell wall biosynthesis